ncbi:hypothetical protein DFH09DRAFT_920435, partial [Mycena vulgaris]
MHFLIQDRSPEDRQIIEWASPLNFFPRQADILGTRQPGTGEWLLKNDMFRKWKTGEIRALWCRGMPGAGKTVLASIVVDDLTDLANENTTTSVAALYLDHNTTLTQSPTNLLAAIWRQLAVEKPISSLIHRFYKKHHARGTPLSLDETYSVLHSTLSDPGTCAFIVVDALDEYPAKHRHTLLRRLWNLGPVVKLLLTSRPHIRIDDVILNVETVNIRAAEEDIRKYVEEQISNSDRLQEHLAELPSLRDSIEDSIVKCSDGMFLLAKLHMDSLRTKQTVRDVLNALDNLSSDLDGAYSNIVKRINLQSDDDKKLAWRTLSWVLNAKKLLRPSQLREALAVEPAATGLDPYRQTNIGIILSVCAGLVV